MARFLAKKERACTVVRRVFIITKERKVLQALLVGAPGIGAPRATHKASNAMIRLNKYLAHAGIASRRQCDGLIAGGHVSIDGQAVRDLGTQIDPEKQKVAVDGHGVRAERPVYWLVNKPRGYLCTNFDPAGRPLAIDLVPHVRQRVYTVGRLDEDSEGLLLLTNDGELAHRLMHPRYGVEKTYIVQVAGNPHRDDLQQLLRGVWLSDGHVRARHVKRLRHQGESTWLEIVLSEGKNREVRRMLARLGHKVMRLRRIALGRVYLGRLAVGKSRPVKHDELEGLRRVAEGIRRRDQRRKVHAGAGHAEDRQRRGKPPGANARTRNVRREKKKPR